MNATANDNIGYEYVFAGNEIRLLLLQASIRMTALCSLQHENEILLVGPVEQHLKAIRNIKGLELVHGAIPRTFHDHETGRLLVETKYTLILNEAKTKNANFNELFASVPS